VSPTPLRSTQTEGERCPWCDQPITHSKFEEIRARIEAEERKRTAEAEKHLEAELAQARTEAAAKAEAERQRLEKEAETRVRAAVDEATEAAGIASAAKIAEAEKAKTLAEEQVNLLKVAQDDALNERLQEQRTALEKDKADALNAERAKNFSDRQKIQDRVELLQRQLEKKTADELGEGAEIDLFEALKEAFSDDHITRVGRGKEGVDIIHKILDAGRECGSIVYDCKNRTAWRHDFASKLRKDQLAAKAEHAILSSLVFPAGAKQLCMRDGVIVCNPARVVVIVEMLRRQLVHTHTMRLSVEARAEKTAKLYDYMTSDHCAQLLDQIAQRAEDVLDLDVKEKKTHESTWKQRGELVRSIERAHLDLSSEIDRIIGGHSLRAVK